MVQWLGWRLFSILHVGSSILICKWLFICKQKDRQQAKVLSKRIGQVASSCSGTFYCFFVLHICIHPDSINPINFWHNFVADGYPFNHLWFVWFLAVCYLLIPFIQKALDKNNSHYKIYSSFLLICCIIEVVAEIIFSFQIVVCVFVFGMWYGKSQAEKKLENKKLQKILCASIIAICYSIFMILRYCIYSSSIFLNNLKQHFLKMFKSFFSTVAID